MLQGGGALGAYQLGVYEALRDAGIEPDWVIGTSIGAINAALIAGNAPALRLPRLHEFWQRIEQRLQSNGALAAHYSTEPLRRTLHELVDFSALRHSGTRLTVGAVHANSGSMRCFDSRSEELAVDHILASGALPPAFPAVRIDGEPYWDGGIYSNTPIEAVLDDNPRLDALIFAVNVWHQSGPEPTSIWQVMGRQKDIQYASRADSHIARQKQIHRLRHVIRELTDALPAARRKEAAVKALSAWGCGTTMHVVHLSAPRQAGEDHTKDIDFTPAGMQARRAAGYADSLKMIERSPWQDPADPIEGVIEHR